MQKPENLKKGDQFRVIEGDQDFKLGEIITLKHDNGGDYQAFWKADRSNWYSINFSYLEPVTKTVRDAQVQINKRIKELMIEQGLDTSNEMLVLDITIIYVQAQRDLLVQQREESK